LRCSSTTRSGSTWANSPTASALQILQAEPAIPIVAVIRRLQRAPLSQPARRVPSEREFAVRRGHFSARRPASARSAASSSRAQRDDCFDLTAFFAHAIGTKSWDCPICHVRIAAEDLCIAPESSRLATQEHAQ
jgi:hypothetical protein